MDLIREISDLTQDREDLRQDMISLRAMLKEQSKLIKELTESRTETLSTRFVEPFEPGRFPLVDQQDLDNFEQTVTPENSDKLVHEAKYLLSGQGFIKSFNRIISGPLILNYNVEGKHGKQSLQDYKNFLEILYKATAHDGMTYSEFLDEVRAALRYQKHRLFRIVSERRRRERNKH